MFVLGLDSLSECLFDGLELEFGEVVGAVLLADVDLVLERCSGRRKRHLHAGSRSLVITIANDSEDFLDGALLVDESEVNDAEARAVCVLEGLLEVRPDL